MPPSCACRCAPSSQATAFNRCAILTRCDLSRWQGAHAVSSALRLAPTVRRRGHHGPWATAQQARLRRLSSQASMLSERSCPQDPALHPRGCAPRYRRHRCLCHLASRAQESRNAVCPPQAHSEAGSLRLRGPNGARDEFHLAATAQNLRNSQS